LIWHPLTILQGIFPYAKRRAAAAMARRWQGAVAADPRLAQDVIELGDVLTAQPARLTEGYPTPALPDATTLAYAAGRRDMALQLLALMNLPRTHIHNLMKDHDDDN
jgi:hypothetical protein